ARRDMTGSFFSPVACAPTRVQRCVTSRAGRALRPGEQEIHREHCAQHEREGAETEEETAYGAVLRVVLQGQSVELYGDLGIQLRQPDVLPGRPVLDVGSLDDVLVVAHADGVVRGPGRPVLERGAEPAGMQRFNRLQDE